MRWQAVAYRKVFLLVAVAVVLGGWSVQRAEAQLGAQAGVAIDAKGVVHRQLYTDPTGQGNRQRAAAALASLSHDVAKFSRLRKISLTRLERAIRAAQGAPTDEMRYLAGLLRVRYVFYYPDSKDIVMAGPAEGWVDRHRRPHRGAHHRPAGRAVAGPGRGPAGVPAGGKDGVAMIGCSIDPTQEGLAAHAALPPQHRLQLRRRTGTDGGPVRDPEPARGTGHASGQHQRRLAQDPLRPGDGRGRLPHEAHRHRPGTAAGEDGQLRR